MGTGRFILSDVFILSSTSVRYDRLFDKLRWSSISTGHLVHFSNAVLASVHYLIGLMGSYLFRIISLAKQAIKSLACDKKYPLVVTSNKFLKLISDGSGILVEGRICQTWPWTLTVWHQSRDRLVHTLKAGCSEEEGQRECQSIP